MSKHEEKEQNALSYKDTLNLPTTDFPIRAQAHIFDKQILERWEQEKLYVLTYLHNKGKQQFILYDEDFRLHDMIIDKCKQAGFNPNIVFETSQLELMTQMVAADFGVALLPSKICKGLDPNNFIYRPFVDPPLCLQLEIVWKKNRYLSHATREFLMFARQKYGEHEEITEN